MAFTSRLELVIDSRTGERSLKRVEGSLERVERAGVRTGSQMDRTGRDINRLRGYALAASGALTGLAGALSVREIIRMSDAWDNAGNQIRQVTSSSAELADVQQRLVDVSRDTRSNFDSTANLYARLARATTEMGLSQEELIGLTTTINQSFATSGATATEAAAAITQLSQGLAAGALRGDEFNSVSEQAPGIMRAIAESLDMTIGELREFAAEGGITAQIVVDALQGASEEIGTRFAGSVATFGQKMEVARTELVQWVGTSSEVDTAVGTLGDSILVLARNIDTIATAAGGLALVIGGRLTASLVAVTAAKLAATRQAVLYQAALARMAGVSTTAAAATGALSGALALLGGPVGAAIVAGGAIFYFREELGLTIPQLDANSDAVYQLTGELKNLSRAEAQLTLTRLVGKLAEARAATEDVSEALQKVGRPDTPSGGGGGILGVSGSEITRQTQAIGEIAEASNKSRQEVLNLEAAIGLAEGRLSELDDASERAGPGITEVGTAATQTAGSAREMASGAREAQREADELARSMDSLLDRLFPLQAAQRQYAQDLQLLNAVDWSERTMTQAQAQERLAAAYQDSLVSLGAYDDAFNAYSSLFEPAQQGIEGMNTRMNEASNINRQFANGATRGMQSFIGDVMSGRDAMGSLSDSFRSFASDFLMQMSNMIAQQAIFNAMQNMGFGGSGGGGGGVGGFFSNILTMSDGGHAGYAGGGYTGAGGKFEPAGIVHKGEFVVQKAVTQQPGVLPFLTRLNKGFAEGGHVGRAPAVPAPAEQREPDQTNIYNLIDSDQMAQAVMASSQGKKGIMNVVRANKREFQSILGTANA